MLLNVGCDDNMAISYTSWLFLGAISGLLLLIGTVVNGPMLIAHQAMTNVREFNRDALHAECDAVDIRLCHGAMFTLTTVYGLGHLVLVFWEGTGLYRGVGGIDHSDGFN